MNTGQSTKRKVGILLLFYNDLEHVERLAAAVNKLTYKDFQVYCLDNNPILKHTEVFTKVYPHAICIQSDKNTGFAGGNNILAKLAINDGCEYIWVLNADMEPEPESLQDLLNSMENDAKLGMIGPLLLIGKSKDNPIIQLFGCNVKFKTQKKEFLYADKFLKEVSLPSELRVNMINAGSLLIRSKIIKHSFLFEESYFLYNDEIDIARRIKEKGYDIAVNSNARVWHYHNWSAKNVTGYNLMYYYMMRNKMLYYRKFNMFRSMVLEMIKQLILAPVILKFCIRTSKLSMFRFYYLGLFHGFTGKSGEASIKFY